MSTPWQQIDVSINERGLMGILEFPVVPFEVQRLFWLSNVPIGELRGGHAHQTCEQFIICLTGSVHCRVEQRGGHVIEGFMQPGHAFHLQTFNWLVISEFSKDSTVLVLANEPYNESEYIRSYDEFKAH
jgi:UDP-2-acetamido-3-amino-2,3-dideoxy-glucuronate N-acetyltransferase